MMRPNFALDLSTQGIALLRRSDEDGWTPVGEVRLDAPDIARALAALRRTAQADAPEGMHSALIIPDDQIRYMTLPAAAGGDDDHGAAAARALDGATPYALTELRWDWTRQGDRLQVAAVARETLDEAERFAREHGFNPVCFVARPGPDLFDGTPDFGTTAEAGTGAAPPVGTGPSDADPTSAPQVADADATAPAVDVPERLGSDRLPDGATRPTETTLPDADARALSGAARASLAPREGGTELETTPSAPSPDTRARPVAGATPAAPPPRTRGMTKADEAERLTIFGARSDQGAQRDRPRSAGRALIAVVLIGVVGLAGWAAVFPGSEIGRLLHGATPEIAVTPEVPEMERADPEPDSTTARAGENTPPPDGAERDSAALPAPEAPAPPVATSGGDRPLPIVSWTPPRTPEEERARYAETGIWPVAPDAPPEPRGGSLDTFYQTSIDSDVAIGDAVALDIPRGSFGGAPPARPSLPPPADRSFALDARGLVQATPEGALTPDGVRVFAGPPPVRQPDAPVRTVPLPGLSLTEDAAEALESLSGTRPRPRPETLVEEHERGALGGRTRTEIAMLRPRGRPAAVAESAAPAAPDTAAIDAAVAGVEATKDAAEEAAAEAIARSLKPHLRPQSVARTARAAAPPQIPTSASVARRATERNAIDLRQVNLIGVYGTRGDRRALVRLANGRYRRVQVGDRIDGGRVAAIGGDELRYVKRGRSVVLRLPRG